ncbi:MAG: hypothetical protein NVS9B13_25110 [Candidatus Acidiferrum sp.]
MFAFAACGAAQIAAAQAADQIRELVEIPAVTGNEQELTGAIAEQLKGLRPKTDNLGNVWVTLGSGAPNRLIVTAIDEPGYVVSAITEDGLLRVQRLPQEAPNAVFDSLHFARPVWVMTHKGKVNGVFAGLSVHLQPGRQNAPRMNHPDELYVDLGAKSAEEARAAGVELLDAVVLDRNFRLAAGRQLAGPAIGDRFGAAVLMEVLQRVDPAKLNGTLTVAFVTQGWTGGRGLNRLLTEIQPAEMIYVGRLSAGNAGGAGGDTLLHAKPGDGVLLAAGDSASTLGTQVDTILKFAKNKSLSVTRVAADSPRIVGYANNAELPAQFVQLSIPVLWPNTPAEFISHEDLSALETLLVNMSGPEGKDRSSGEGHSYDDRWPFPAIEILTTAYGASGHENAVREAVKGLLPEWARKQSATDAAGNLVLHLSAGTTGTKSPKIVFVAHLDEIGFEVKKIEDDGRLLSEVLGGGYNQYYLGHVVLVHKADGSQVGGVLELPEGWDKPNFEWPQNLRSMDEPVHVYVGTKSKEETQKLGIKPGDFVTIPKQYRPLLGMRANARSFDDRVGCAALIEAVKALGRELPGRDVTFIWSTREEVGLEGAAAAAERMSKEGKTPDFVFAIDTFVSSDSPLETKRFADAELGKGFVVRAVDNSNITPRPYLDRVVQLAKTNKIPVQFGVTGGGNDGSVFLRYGSVDIPLGWPLRYSHSPAEVIDMKDADALAKIIVVLARDW